MEIGIGFKYRNTYTDNKYEIIRTTRRSWIIKRIDGGRPFESGISHTGLRIAFINGSYEELGKKHKRVKLNFLR